MTEARTVCISHGEDVDGLTCAALLLRLKNATPILVNYDEFEEALNRVESPLSELYICDLNMRESLMGEMLRLNGFTRVTIVDHHPTSEGVLEELEEAGVKVIHSILDCASVLLFDHFRMELGREAGRLAAYAAWSDQFEDGPLASRLLVEYDRQLVQHEALILTHALATEPNAQFRSLVVKELSQLTYPHRIPGSSDAALAHIEDMVGIVETLASEATKGERLAYIKVPEGRSIGTVAGLIIDALGVDVGLCYKLKGGDLVNVSIRSKRGLPFHLGLITRWIAAKHMGFGGGHKRASGASIPLSSLQDFIDDLELDLSK